MASMEMNKEHFYFHDFKIFLISIIYKMQIIVLKNDIKGLILRTDTDKLYPFLDLEIFQQECNHSAACIPFPIIVQWIHPTQICSTATCIWQLKIGKVQIHCRSCVEYWMEPILLCKWIRFCYSAQRKGCGKGWSSFWRGYTHHVHCKKATEITKDDIKTIQDEKDIQIEVPKATTEKELKEVVVDIEKEYGVSEGEVSSKPSLIFPLMFRGEWFWFVDFICKSIIDDSLRW